VSIPVSTSSVVDARGVRPRLRRFLRGLERLLATVGLCFILHQGLFQVSVIVSPSMSPALRGDSYATGDRVLMEKVSGWMRDPRRWEIWFFINAEGVSVAKRIVGLPGEKISIKDGKIFINGREAVPPADFTPPKYYAFGSLADGREADAGSGYYTLGDDSKDSNDSRFLGPVARAELRGRAWLILWPPARIGRVR
jgi:signal peptidase I